MERFIKAISAPGAKGATAGVAPTQRVKLGTVVNVSDDMVAIYVENMTKYDPGFKKRLLDRWLDKVVHIAGSGFVFVLVMAILLTWALLGIKYGQSEMWQVVISDFQAIFCYIFDSFLMRQQLIGHDSIMMVAACLRSRNISNSRMLRQIVHNRSEKPSQIEDLDKNLTGSEFPEVNWLGRLSNFAATLSGHIVTVALYWIGIFVWIGFGQYCGWSNKWQLYINSATSALMVFVFVFLENIREQHRQYTESCMALIHKTDSALELRLRTITGDTIENEPVVIPGPQVTKIQRAIYYYADVVGTLVGIVLMLIVVVIWVVIGPAMSFDANWWLIIGTYSGLIGMNDGFILRNVFYHLGEHEDKAFDQVRAEDLAMFEIIDITPPVEDEIQDSGLSFRISATVGWFCSHELAVVLGTTVMIGLVIGASVMKWSTTGQLVCNVPPSLIETFFMIILITSQNMADAKRRAVLFNIYQRRRYLLSYVNNIPVNDEK
ncbi:Low affinity iron permease-domain-containing protein [Lipomyces chichibuensis]|uniref:Low affinity iron permease-domain-containing protein n=1 Tax=Lipomyces chichibuensis TaxID=1546026 RepID=UPI0033435CA6